jgi:2-polyprenyl-6-methoxyphenol hydroxylase-like FAD-dependent oxidoreductase
VRAIIVGGGIGGLTAAIALERAGIEAHIYERAPALGEVGAGIALWANAIHVLTTLGLGKSLLSRSTPGVEGTFRKADGTVLQKTSHRDLASRFGAALVMLRRTELLALLSNEVLPARLHLGCQCTGFVQDAERVSARFANGETADGDVLIGADGVRSIVRSNLFGDGPPKYAGYTAWRAIVRLDLPELTTGETWGRGKRFGIVPLTDGRVYWFATKNAAEGEKDPESGAKQHVLGLFRGWHEPIVPLIEATDGDSIIRNDIYDRDPLERWSENRVTLLGDAAHPMTPNLGQGACQAMEDALALAVCLKESADVASGLREYERRRIPRSSRIVLESRRIGQVGQWENPILCFLRDAATRLVPSKMTARHIQQVAAPDTAATSSK